MGKELQSFTHWGWTDLDMQFGDLSLLLTPERLTTYDVITAADGLRPALYLSGQLTVFQNTAQWRHFFLGRLDHADATVQQYGGHMAAFVIEETNSYWDEKVAVWYAALRGGKILFDFSTLGTFGLASQLHATVEASAGQVLL